MGAERDSERKNLRLQSFDYSSNRAYFVTVCTQNRQRLLCDIKKGIDGNDAVLIHAPSQAKVSGLTKHHHRVGSDGRSVGATLCGRPGNPHEMIVKWFRELERKFDGAWIDLAVIMPDHVHFIVVIHRSGARAEETARIPGDHTKLLATSGATYKGLGIVWRKTPVFRATTQGRPYKGLGIVWRKTPVFRATTQGRPYKGMGLVRRKPPVFRATTQGRPYKGMGLVRRKLPVFRATTRSCLQLLAPPTKGKRHPSDLSTICLIL